MLGAHLTRRAGLLWVGVVPLVCMGCGSGPPIAERCVFPTREEQGTIREWHRSGGQPLVHVICSWRGMAAALLDAEGGDGLPAACSQLCHWFALVPLGKSPLFP